MLDAEGPFAELAVLAFERAFGKHRDSRLVVAVSFRELISLAEFSPGLAFSGIERMDDEVPVSDDKLAPVDLHLLVQHQPQPVFYGELGVDDVEVN